MPFGDEALATVLEIAVKGSVTCMSSHVGLEVACLVELLDARAERAEK